ncbi:hypothetical protein [Cylindrospermopsis raciborskii]|uniref:hypothetical protein n=1 Tax=Cylindrospermopsis raciborskii TaxID=77022 RepID=UPI001F22811F|nr:hypothetical protein [Cylindrospermopsis raciborskii]MCZ2206351.1 hypothetical protein [Cylindrospermopsis raciborskii PAMP2011]
MNFLSVYTKNEKILWMERGKLPLYQDTNGKKILYIAGVALQVFPGDNFLAPGKLTDHKLDLVSLIASHFSTNNSDIFDVQIPTTDSIHIQPTDLTIASWLHRLTIKDHNWQPILDWGVDSQNSSYGSLCNSLRIFTTQHAYARCVSLINLAKREGWIKTVENSTDSQPLLSVSSIPWLDHCQKLRFYQPDEIHLIQLLVRTVDDLAFRHIQDSINWLAVAEKLSSAFEKFWSNCPIWGYVKIHDLELAKARIGVLILTQVVIKYILEVKLGVTAISQL